MAFTAASLDRIESLIGYKFNDISLLRRAMQHRSYNSRQNNERLEFLGDRILGLTVANFLFKQYPRENEGELTRRFSALVCKEALEEVCLDLRLPIKMRGADAYDDALDAVRADACEAMIGAVFVDGGYEAAQATILRLWQDSLAESGKDKAKQDPRSALQEWAQARALELPEYREVARAGSDHALKFQMAVSVQGHDEASATASSKRLASRKAAAKLLAKLEKIQPKGKDAR